MKLGHIAFHVDDIDAVFKKAINAGGTVIWEPKKGVVFKRTAFFSDINNIPVELIEV